MGILKSNGNIKRILKFACNVLFSWDYIGPVGIIISQRKRKSAHMEYDK